MGRVLGRQLGLVLAAVGALIAVVVAAGCGGAGARSDEPSAAELYAQQIQVGSFTKGQRGIDPDELDRSGSDITTSVRELGKNRYQIVVQNFSDAGFINSFWWKAEDMRITAVTGSSSGTCRVFDSSTLQCTGLAIRPPKCTCLAGGSATVTFVATPVNAKTAGINYGVQGSKLRIGEVTPVPYHIPSYLGSENNVDLPLCAKGQASTEAKPCVHAD
jgi:hypothetical protein